MPTAYNNAIRTPDRPYSPGEFAQYADATGQNIVPESPVTETQPGYSSHPTLQVEAERQNVNALAMPADAHRGDMFVPPSQEVIDHTVAAEAATLIGGVENMLTHNTDLSPAEVNARFDQIVAEEHKRDAMAPNPELQYRQGDEVLEAYNAACAVMTIRRLYAPESYNQ